MYEYYKDYTLEEFEQALLDDLEQTISSEGSLSLPPDGDTEMTSVYFPTGD